MNLSSSQLQQIRALVSREITKHETDQKLLVSEARAAKEKLRNGGCYDDNHVELVKTSVDSMYKSADRISDKIDKLADLQRHVKEEIEFILELEYAVRQGEAAQVVAMVAEALGGEVEFTNVEDELTNEGQDVATAEGTTVAIGFEPSYALERKENNDWKIVPLPTKHNHYFKDVTHLKVLDVYRVLVLFKVTDPAIAHAVKKLLVAGGRGAGKDINRDIQEAIDTLERWKEMQEEDRVIAA